jgi:hypothetical protein
MSTRVGPFVSAVLLLTLPGLARAQWVVPPESALMREIAQDDQLGRIFEEGDRSYWAP